MEQRKLYHLILGFICEYEEIQNTQAIFKTIEVFCDV